jgi:SAM-dependent methyltransferase
VTLAEPRLCDDTGADLRLPARRWFHAADAVELRALSTVEGPVLDIGCGPGRHVAALAERAIPVLGIDITPGALVHARRRAIPVLERCVFDHVPGAGRWRSALLLDGNIGIGGDPVQLVRRASELLAPGGRILVELGSPGTTRLRTRVRFEIDGAPGPWFDWAQVGVDAAGDVAAAADLALAPPWRDGDRWFAWIDRCR